MVLPLQSVAVVIPHRLSGMVYNEIKSNDLHVAFFLQLSRTVRAKHSATPSKDTPSLVYILEVHTGDVRGAGTAANVFVTLEGTKNFTSKQRIRGESCDGFDRASVVKAELQPQEDLGQIQQLKIGHDNSGFGSDWFLEEVVVYTRSNPQAKLYFVCGQWLSRTQGDGLIERSLVATPHAPSTHPQRKTYSVTLVTGNRRGAGTGANVFITLFGEGGTSGEKRLDNDPDNFQRGRQGGVSRLLHNGIIRFFLFPGKTLSPSTVLIWEV